ncbi:UDP-N-acetylmuramate--L-alanine ligase [Kitasatospora sp. NPDC059577]|uniref:UDP-N-acetylmuramate--L-alanine ligase n=1 Tax=Kitasatospora sp. NPDC059577 TaxID=3346873 RepID=UPI003673C652
MINLEALDKDRSIYFVGIGGVGMSSLAFLLGEQGYTVIGSDSAESGNVKALRNAGIEVTIGHDPSNVRVGTSVIVASLAAVGLTNPEVLRGREIGIRVADRAHLLGSVMAQYEESIAVSGTAGKTTTTTLFDRVLTGVGLDPTTVVGSPTTPDSPNYRNGRGKYVVAEACEYYRAFHHIRPGTAVVLNMVPGDHGDYFPDPEDMYDAFDTFIGNIRQGGLLVTSADQPRTRNLGQGRDLRRVTFGFSPEADYQAVILGWDGGRARFAVLYRGESLGEIASGLLGKHNVTNTLAVIATGHQHGLTLDDMREPIESFTGAPRRLQFQGKRYGVNVWDDLACTPEEMQATMSALRGAAGTGRITVVLRPNSYSRVRDLLQHYPDAFTRDDRIVLTGIFRGRDKDTFGMTPKHVLKVLRMAGLDVQYVPDVKEAPNTESILGALHGMREGDTLITVGPNDIAPIGRAWLGSQA